MRTPREVAMKTANRAMPNPSIMKICRKMEMPFPFFVGCINGYRVKGVVIAAMPAT